ncbi:MAG TPA: hypothetical protein VH044_00725 [Polyangiaceae bacterium]|jgi:hypothetical protein|nr:hypothetical protein [Polyangiaceae bacterium]
MRSTDLGAALLALGLLSLAACGGSSDKGTGAGQGADAMAPDAMAPDASPGAQGNPTGCPGPVIQGSSYDQSCTSDSDCITVAGGDPCLPCEIECATMSAPINRTSQAKYMADVAGPLGAVGKIGCLCPLGVLVAPCCLSGKCTTNQCPAPSSLGNAACVLAGGNCFSGGSCAAVGSQDCGPGGFCCLAERVALDAGGGD